MARAAPTRGGSASNASAGLAPSTRPAELIALSSSVFDANSLSLMKLGGAGRRRLHSLHAAHSAQTL